MIPPQGNIAWAPDSRKLALVLADEIFVYDSWYDSLELLVDCEALLSYAICFDPAWSPDGTMIAFAVADAAAGPDVPEEGVYVTEATCVISGADCRRATRGPFPIQETPTFSPDNTIIAGITHDGDIALTRASDATLLLTFDFPPSTFPHHLIWSPDSQWLAYVEDCTVGLISAESGVRRQLFTHPDACADGPLSWLTVAE
jgi:Tol biopolymer transport system component